jgi:hypothetical protein
MKTGHSIVKEIRSSESFARLTYRQRDLWQGLIETADDQGRCVGRPGMVRSAIWPEDNISLDEVQAELDVLASGDDPFIQIYQVDGKTYIQIIHWWRYQRMQWAGRSAWPPPPGWNDHCHYETTGRKIIDINWNPKGGYDDRKDQLAGTPASEPASQPSGDLGSEPSGKLDGGLESTLGLRQVKDRDKLIEKSEIGQVESADDDQARKSWLLALGELQRQMSRADYDAYMRSLEFIGLEGDAIKIAAQNRYTIDFLTRRKVKLILEKILQGFMEREVTLQFVIDLPDAVPKTESAVATVK